MRIGYQGEPGSYSHKVAGELFPAAERIGLHSFAEAFDALERGEVDRLTLPVENSTTGSVLPVLDRLPGNPEHGPVSVIAEHLIEVRHALLGLPGSALEDIAEVRSHPQALAQAEETLLILGIDPVARPDTAGAVREVAEGGDVTVAALAPTSGRGGRAVARHRDR